MRVLNLLALHLVTLLSNRCACCYKMGLNLSWMIRLLCKYPWSWSRASLSPPPRPAPPHPPLPATPLPCYKWPQSAYWFLLAALTHVKPHVLRQDNPGIACCYSSGKNGHPSCRPFLSLTALQLTFPLRQVRPGCPGQQKGCCFSSNAEKIGWKPAWTWLVISEVTTTTMWEFSIGRIFPKRRRIFTKSDFPKENVDDKIKKVRKIQTVDSLQIGVFGFAELSQDHTTHPNLSHRLWGRHTYDLSHVVLHGPREGSRPGNLCVISTLQHWQCLRWKGENLRREDSTRHWAAGLSLWTCYFEPQGWTSHALRQTQKFWTDLMHFLSARLVWQNFNPVSLQLYCFVGTVLWVPIIFCLHDCMSAFTSMTQVSSIKTCAMGITWLCEYCGRCNLAKTGENLSFEHVEVCCCWCLREVWFETQKFVLVERNGTGLLHER